MRVDVDGEAFDVVEETPGRYHLTWSTGPNPRYGFSSAGARMDHAQLVEAIRGFLAQVDPARGYLE